MVPYPMVIPYRLLWCEKLNGVEITNSWFLAGEIQLMVLSSFPPRVILKLTGGFIYVHRHRFSNQGFLFRTESRL